MIARLTAMLRDQRGAASEFSGTPSQIKGDAPWAGPPTLYPSLLQALKDGYQVYQQGPGVYFLRQRFPEGWKFAHVSVATRLSR